MQKSEKKSSWFTHIKVVLCLIILQYLLDILYVSLYPSVNPIRATLIGLSALIIVTIPFIKNILKMNPLLSFIPIYSSALFGALVVQAGVVTSKSPASAIAHIAILIVTYLIIISVQKSSKKGR